MSKWESDLEPRHVPLNKKSAESKLRRSSRNCPVCLAPLKKIAPRTRIMKMCSACQAHPSSGKSCMRCSSQEIWENKGAAACRQCGLHGAKSVVIATQ
jgi:hypothetical protein